MDVEALKTLANKEKMDIEKFTKAVDTCSASTNADRCDLAFQFYECMKKTFGRESENSN